MKARLVSRKEPKAFKVPNGVSHSGREGASIDDDSTDALARKAATGCARSFKALVETQYDAIHGFAWRWCGNRVDAEDIAQSVCVKLAGAISAYRGDARFITWVYRITYNATIDHLRARQRMRPTEPSNIIKLVDGPTGDTPESQMMDVQLWDEVRGLPPKQRDAVLLVYGQDLSHAEAATILECTEKTVSWHLHTARKTLKTRLEAVE